MRKYHDYIKSEYGQLYKGEEPKDSFCIYLIENDPRTWIPVHHFVEEREYLLIWEMAEILKRCMVIRRKTAKNGHSEDRFGVEHEYEVQGIQQLRKFIRSGELESQLKKNSKRWGYHTHKYAFADFFLRYTGRIFKETDFEHNLFSSKKIERYLEHVRQEMEQKQEEQKKKIKKLEHEKIKLEQELADAAVESILLDKISDLDNKIDLLNAKIKELEIMKIAHQEDIYKDILELQKKTKNAKLVVFNDKSIRKKIEDRYTM